MAHETFGQRLKRLRSEMGLTMTQLGYQVGVSEGAIRQLESGQSKSASFQVGIKLAEKLGVNPHYLAFGEGPAKQEATAANVSQTEARIADLEARLEDVLKRQVASIETVERTFAWHEECFVLLSRFLEARGVLKPREREQIQKRLKSGS